MLKWKKVEKSIVQNERHNKYTYLYMHIFFLINIINFWKISIYYIVVMYLKVEIEVFHPYN